MKIQVFRVVCIVSLFVLGAVLVNAQSASHIVNANIPFDFEVGNQILPKGEYTIKTDAMREAQAVLTGPHGTTFVLVSQTEKRGGGHAYELVFNEVNNQYFLSTIWMGNDLNGRKLSVSRREREMTAQVGKPVLPIHIAAAR